MRSELYLNNVRVDLKEEIQCSLNLMIADIREPKNRNGSFSKTIKLAGDKLLNKLLGQIYDVAQDIQTSGVVNFVPDFNPNLKCSAILYADGLEQFRGYMKLTSIERDQMDFNLLYYNVVLFGEVANIYTAIGDKKLTDLTFSEYNHTYNKATQKATWTNTNYGTGYVYPMINYGNISATSWDVNNFFPAIYLREYLDKIFKAAGYTWTSTFLDSTYFKHLIVPFAGDKLTITASQQTARLFSAYTTTSTSGVALSSDPILFNAETSDPSNQYDTATGYFTVANSGYYSFYSSGVVTYDAVTTVVGGGATAFNVTAIVTRGASVFYYPVYADTTFSSAATYTSGQTIKAFTHQGWTQDLQLLAGDTVKIRIGLTATFWTGTIGQTISSNQKFLNRITNTNILDGGSLDMASALPVDIRQADFFSSILRTWNLYCEPDKTTPNNLIIDTYDAFYGAGTNRDWTRKVDSSKQMTVIPMGALDAIRYRLKYADDTDYWNKFYTDKWKESFGEKNLDITNDFLKNVSTNEVIFAPTPIIGDSAHDRIIPEIYSLGNSGVKTMIRSKLRILYWAGATNTNYSWSYTSSVSGTSTETTYPYSGHVDNPIAPTVDLSFGVPREIYYVNPYGSTVYTNDNIYNRYHAKFLAEITDKNSKIVQLYVRLRPIDIYNISFRDKIFIDGHYYRLQKVIDYNPISEGVTKVELLKLKAGVSFSPLSKTLTFTAGEMFNDGSRAPATAGNIGLGDILNTSTNITVGSANYVSGTGRNITVNGNQNRVGNNTQNVSILNSSGVVVMDGLSNVSVVGTNDIIISESNVSYVFGVRSVGSSDIHTATTSQTITSLGIWNCTGAMTLTLSTEFFRTGDRITVKRIGGGAVTISGGGINIDGSATYSLSSLYQTVTIYYNGSVYYSI